MMSAIEVDTGLKVENALHECIAKDDTTADELFDSFMEIANDPQFQNCDQVVEGLEQRESLDSQLNVSEFPGAEKLDNEKGDCCSVDSPVKDALEMDESNVSTTLSIDGLVKSKASDLSSEDQQHTFCYNSIEGSYGAPREATPVQSTGEPAASVVVQTGGSDMPTDLESTGVPMLSKLGESVDADNSLSIKLISQDVTDNESIVDKNLEAELSDSSPESNDSGVHVPNNEKASSDAHEENGKDMLAGKTTLDHQGETALSRKLSKAVEELGDLEQLLSTAVFEFQVKTNCTGIDENNAEINGDVNAKEEEMSEKTDEDVDHVFDRDLESKHPGIDIKPIEDAKSQSNTNLTLEVEEQAALKLQDVNEESGSGVMNEMATQGSEDSKVELDDASNLHENASSGIQELQAVAPGSPQEKLEQEAVAESVLEKAESVNDLESELVNVQATSPDIEIIMTDDGGVSERKSLDSLNTEDSSTSGLTSLSASDECMDSDAASDCGDDEDDAAFDPDNLKSSVCQRKSWLLQFDRDRLSSDSSAVSELDFVKDHSTKPDGTDGHSSGKDYIRGHLMKLGGSGLTPKNWRKRWCVLRSDNCLYYYKSSKHKDPCGVIILSNYSVSKAPEINRNHCFKLTKGGAKSYCMCAGSEGDMKKWMVAMMDAIKDSAKEVYMSNTVALGVAKLLHYTLNAGEQSGKKFYFNAVSPDQSLRSYHFFTESEMDRTRWLSRLEESIKKGSSAQ
ncbi:uncharacterized protein LOC141859264 isoform X2 [Acropora palmata]|uniref:uncharacterized protein LOC141859264 isoform X2 n=1 Tax=Acropora palmata TaxID=6131 RepID=UPI003DA0D380